MVGKRTTDRSKIFEKGDFNRNVCDDNNLLDVAGMDCVFRQLGFLVNS